jgi:hypothetical protein
VIAAMTLVMGATACNNATDEATTASASETASGIASGIAGTWKANVDSVHKGNKRRRAIARQHS